MLPRIFCTSKERFLEGSSDQAAHFQSKPSRGVADLSKRHAFRGAYQNSTVAVAESVAVAQQTDLSSRRYYDLAYVLIAFLAFPLYWVKVIDTRLCSGSYPEENDPWLITPPSPAWVEAWPCSGNQMSKLRHVLLSPRPFIRSLLWPFSFSELHFFTSIIVVVIGGLLMLAITHGSKYDMENPWRLLWAFASRAQVRAAPILVKVLRPQTPWPVAISQSLPFEGPANLLYSVALMGPWRHQVMGALLDVSYIIIVCKLYGSSWPYAIPPHLLVLQQAVCGLLTVIISALIPPFFTRCTPAGLASTKGSAKSCCNLWRKVSKVSDRFSEEALDKTDFCGESGQPESRTASGPDAITGSAATAATALSSAPVVADSAAAAGAVSAEMVSSGLSLGPSCVQGQRLLTLCRRLVHGTPSSAKDGVVIESGRPSHLSAQDNTGTCPQDSTWSGLPSWITSGECRGSGGGGSSGRNKHRRRAHDGTSAGGGDGLSSSDRVSREPCGQRAYGDALAWTHLHMKVQHLEPSALPAGICDRLRDAVAQFCPDVANADVAIRSGCVEVHLDLVRGVAAQGRGPGVSGVEINAELAAPRDRGTETEGNSHFAPASMEQQGLASCILQALGLPQGYDAAVSAQVGAHLLTLTPAADSGGGWAVLGTRRMQAHEVPWVTRVDPPTVVAPAPAAAPPAALGSTAGGRDCSSSSRSDSAGGHVATLRLTISGSAERLAVAHEDGDLEMLALFEGTFLKFSDLQWGPIEESPFAAVSSDSAAAAGGAVAPRIVQLPPSLALSRRVLTANLVLPVGRTGAVSLLLMRRGTAGQSHSLLLLQPEEASIAQEVTALQDRVHAIAWGAASDGGSGPPASSVASFVRDLGHWLQYRDYWRRKAAIYRMAAGGGGAGGSGGTRAARFSGRLSSSWMAALWSWNCWKCDGGATRLQVKMQRCRYSTDQPGTIATLGRGGAAAGQLHEQHVRLDDSDLLDQGHSEGSGGDGRGISQIREVSQAALRPGRRDSMVSANGHLQPMARRIDGAAPLVEEQQRLALGSLPAFGQRAYQNHMHTARRVLLEFALEQRCAAVAAALLEPSPVPPPSQTAARTSAAYGSARYLAELAESCRAANPDGLTLLHRAVRSGDAATVETVLRASARAAAAAAANFAVVAAPASVSAATATPLAHQSSPPQSELQAPLSSRGDGIVDRRQLSQLYDWDTPDVHGITPLHYLAVLDDGGALARHVLRTYAEALALWDVGRSDIPSPSSFAAQNGLDIDTDALCRERELAGSIRCRSGSKARGTRPLFLTALLGFPCGEVERCYQRFVRTRAQGGALPPSRLLLTMHVVACAAGLLQVLTQTHACCRRGILPLVVLQGGSFLLALYSHRPVARTRRNVCCVAAWALQSLAVGMLLARTVVSPRTRPWPLSCVDTSLHSTADSIAIASAGDSCGSALFHHGLLALHHALAVAAVPYTGRYTQLYALHKVLAVQAVEVLACVLLLFLGCVTVGCSGSGASSASDLLRPGPLGKTISGPGSSTNGSSGGVFHQDVSDLSLGLAWAGDAAAHVAGGSLLRGVLSSLLILAADLRTRAVFLCSHSGGAQSKRPEMPQQQRQEQHAKLD